MDKSSYRLLFDEAVRRALQQIGLAASAGEPVVEFHGEPGPQNPIKLDQAFEFLWLSSARFHLIVDVGAFIGPERPPVIFVRPSGHAPRPFSETWKPNDLGPFKLIDGLTRGQIR